MKFLSFLTAGGLGFLLFEFLSSHSSNKKLPTVKIKWIQFLPYIRVHIRGRIIFLHHWMNLSIILVVTLIYSGGFLDYIFPKSLLLGGIIQGFTFPDWKRIILRIKTD